MSARCAGLAVLVFLSVAPAPAPASEAHEAPQTVMCGVLRDRASGRAGDVRLRREQSRVTLAAAEEIMVLYDKLWKTRSVPRLEYLGGQRDRDVARVTIRSVERHLERELAALAQFEALCSKGAGAARVDAIREASRTYREADCLIVPGEHFDISFGQTFINGDLAGLGNNYNSGGTCVAGGNGNEAVYELNPLVSGDLDVTVTPVGFSTYVYYSKGSCTPNSPITCGSGINIGQPVSLSINATANQPIYLVVDSFTPAVTGTYEVYITLL